LSGGSGSGTGSGTGGHAGGRGIGDASSPYEVAASAETGNAAGNAAGYAGSAADGPVLAANGGVGGVGGGHAINGQPTGGSVSNAPASGNTLTGNNILTDSNIPTNGTALTSGTSMNGVAPASGQAGDAAIGNGTVMGNSAASSNGAASGNGPASGYATDVQGQPKTGSDGQRASAAGIASTSGSDRMPSGGQPVETPVDYVAGQPPREQAASTATSSDSSGKSRPGRLYRPGEWEDAPEKPPEPPKKSDKDEDKDRFGRKRERPVAEQRGDDWGLHNASRGAMGVTRSIRVECLADKIVVISERGAANNKVIPFGPRTAASVDAFVSAIWEQMDAWGIAGRGMYWRPVLQVHVAPGAEQRFADLSALLEGSGLTVVKK
jgi:hypothetical protein